MTEDQARLAMFMHWPGFLPQARPEDGSFVVRLLTWPPSDKPKRGELQARSAEGYAPALLDLATFTPPLIRCREPGCVLCVPR